MGTDAVNEQRGEQHLLLPVLKQEPLSEVWLSARQVLQ